MLDIVERVKDMYKVEEMKKGIRVYGVKDFNPKHVFECGQCFRWNLNPMGHYCGVAGENYAEIKYSDGVLEIIGSTKEEFYTFWLDYFDLERDYSKIKGELSLKDEYMRRAIEFGKGIRILRQEPFETLVSFIISANNNIPRIKKCIENLCRNYGEKIKDDVYAFPKPHNLANVCENELSDCIKAGYRCNYIVEASRLFVEQPFSKESFQKIDIANARRFMRQYKGVGPKVADCILLFTGSYYNAFPVDVWVRKVMTNLYNVSTHKEIDEFVQEYFGSIAGFAQQYLFYAIREGFLKVEVT